MALTWQEWFSVAHKTLTKQQNQIASRILKVGQSSLTSAYHFSREGTAIADVVETRVMARQTETGIAKATIPDAIRKVLEERLSPD